jgi:prevent-host-death family protein
MPVAPTETHIKLTDTKQHLSQIVNQVARGESRVVIEKSGLPVAAIISAGEYQRFLQLDAERERRFAAMERIGEAFMDVPLTDLEAEVDRAVSEIRAGKSHGSRSLP